VDNITPISCPGSADAAINVTVSGGVTPYSYQWYDATGVISVDEDLADLGPGSYHLEVTDNNGCTAYTDTIAIADPQPITVTAQVTDVKCNGGNDGTIILTPVGGTPPYQFAWTSSDGTGLIPDAQDQTTLTKGTYAVTITDNHNCRVTETYTINEPDPLGITEDVTNPSCPDEANGSIRVTVSGGTVPYVITWSNGQSGEEITDLSAGTYTVTVTDNNLCTATKDIELVYSGSSCLRIPTVLTPNGDGHNDVWRIGNIEMYPNVVIDIYTRWGKHIFHSDKGYSTPWDGRYKGKLLPMDSYHYIINLGDGSEPITGNVTVIR
jgi:gliding motility-associated-like protein